LKLSSDSFSSLILPEDYLRESKGSNFRSHQKIITPFFALLGGLAVGLRGQKFIPKLPIITPSEEKICLRELFFHKKIYFCSLNSQSKKL
jgi:hypothetical protein